MKTLFIRFLALAAGTLASHPTLVAQTSRSETTGRAEAAAQGGASATAGTSSTGGTSTDPASSDATEAEAAERSGPAASSVRSSTSTHTNADGTTVTTITTERDGKKTIRTIIVGKDGEVVVSDPAAGSTPASPVPPPKPIPASGWLGVHSVPVSDVLRSQLDLPEGQGVVLEFVADDGPAAAAGLRPNDIVLGLDGTPVGGVSAFRERLGQTKPGQPIKVEFLRKGKVSTADVTLGERPADADPGSKVAFEAIRLTKESNDKAPGARRGVVVDGTGKTHVVENGDPFDLLLNDPNVPEDMKAHLRESRDLMKKALPEEVPAAPETR